ncbi:MAG: transglycosylase domain-containing protein [Lachnospiraceae bacterium]|nr:transglycosylase domain-containing protein [Lachnospiraceae bacterium]
MLASAPDISKITVTPSGRSSFVYDADGNQIAKLVSANANRIPVGSQQISQAAKDAFVAIEDERFYEHNGIDIQGIMRAGIKALKDKSLSQGASTITQQLLKNNVFTSWTEEENNVEKVKRKIQEQYLAIQLEKNMSKDDILVNYLNTINMGQNTLGIEAAALRYFGKHASELDVSEASVIAAITQNPSRYNPIIHPDNNASRREDVLRNMERLGYITEAEKKAALADNVYDRIQTVNSVQGESQVTSYYVDAVTEQVYDDLLAAGYNENQAYTLMYSGGIKIHSYMDHDIQQICDEEFAREENYPTTKWQLKYRLTIQKADGSLENHSSEMFRSYFRQSNRQFNMLYKEEESAYADIETYQQAVLEEGDEVYAESITLTVQPQISFTVIDQKTGEVKAMIGGRGVKEASRTFNRATQSMRQPGSCFKVLASFGPAIDAAGFTLATTVNDAPFNYYNGTPVSNWYGKDEYYGLCNLRYGIYWSLNVVAVKTITMITPELGYQYLLNFGITTLEDAKAVGDQIYTDIGQPLALGGITNGVINLELCAAYAAIANMGVYIEPRLYSFIEDADGNIIIDNRELKTRQVIKDTTAYLLTSAMKDCISRGTGTNARFAGMSMAGKTGTTSDSKDIWFAAYTPYYTGCCWVGYDEPVELNSAESQMGQKLWKAVMQRVHEELPDIGFEVPEGIVRCAVCKQSGKIPTEFCTEVYEEYFTKDTVPEDPCNVHYVGRICRYDNLPATAQCPFAYEGVGCFIPPEDESLWAGSATLDATLDPLAAETTVPTNTTGHCQHDEAFFSQPNWEDIYYIQYNEILARNGWTEMHNYDEYHREEQNEEQQNSEQITEQTTDQNQNGGE